MEEEMSFEQVKQADPEIYALMEKELKRQQDHLELIASENFVSQAVMETMGSHLSMSTRLNELPSSEPKNYLVPNMPMFNPTLAPRPTRQFILPCWNRVIQFWVCDLIRGDI
jgi:hypothetical protein